jgi:D-threo-aldose 1-dehydrogenase
VPEDLLDRANRIADVCEAHGVTLPAAAAQFVLGHPAVATVCLGARSAEQIQRNATLFDDPIPELLWADLREQGLLRSDAPTPIAGIDAEAGR